jgi:hypothetical protein
MPCLPPMPSAHFVAWWEYVGKEQERVLARLLTGAPVIKLGDVGGAQRLLHGSIESIPCLSDFERRR